MLAWGAFFCARVAPVTQLEQRGLQQGEQVEELQCNPVRLRFSSQTIEGDYPFPSRATIDTPSFPLRFVPFPWWRRARWIVVLFSPVWDAVAALRRESFQGQLMPAQEHWLHLLREVSQRGERKLTQVPHLHALIQEWWEQPAQFCTPWQRVTMSAAEQEGVSYQDVFDQYRSLLAQFGK